MRVGLTIQSKEDASDIGSVAIRPISPFPFEKQNRKLPQHRLLKVIPNNPSYFRNYISVQFFYVFLTLTIVVILALEEIIFLSERRACTDGILMV